MSVLTFLGFPASTDDLYYTNNILYFSGIVEFVSVCGHVCLYQYKCVLVFVYGQVPRMYMY